MEYNDRVSDLSNSNKPTASSSEMSLTGDFAASSFQNSSTGSSVAGSSQKSMTGGSDIPKTWARGINCGCAEVCVCQTHSISLSVSEQQGRKICTHCGQELAHASYSRHQICLGKREDTCESKEFSRSPIGCDLDSTFDFESTSSEDDWIEDNYSNGNDMFESVDTVSLHNENNFSELDTDDKVSSYDASSDGEMWNYLMSLMRILMRLKEMV